MRVKHHRPNRRGSVLVFFAMMLIVIFAVTAFAVDLGYLNVVRSQLQNTADATALAATWDLIDEGVLSGTADPTRVITQARKTASQYAALNTPSNDSVALAGDDITIGFLQDQSNPNALMSFADPSRYNAVRIRVRKTAEQNGEVPLFFARALGMSTAAVQAESTAAFLDNFLGFNAPSTPGGTLGILPFALDLDTWNQLLAGHGSDDWTWDGERITAGADGVLEINLYPQGTGSPGNRGTIDIGGSNNSTADIARQILHGVNANDLARLGGKLELNESGVLDLNGDTGISAGVKDELASVMGQPKVIPIFREVTGPGNNAQYTIVKFAGVRIMEVQLTGKMSGKRVIIQPAKVVAHGAIPSTDTKLSSYFIYSPVRLVR